MRTLIVSFPTFRMLLCALAAVSVNATSLVAQDGAIAGIVKDAKTGAELSTVQVEVRGADDAAVAGDFTGSSGAYRIAVPAGVYSVTFSSPGWSVPTGRFEDGVVTWSGFASPVYSRSITKRLSAS